MEFQYKKGVIFVVVVSSVFLVLNLIVGDFRLRSTRTKVPERTGGGDGKMQHRTFSRQESHRGRGQELGTSSNIRAVAGEFMVGSGLYSTGLPTHHGDNKISSQNDSTLLKTKYHSADAADMLLLWERHLQSSHGLHLEGVNPTLSERRVQGTSRFKNGLISDFNKDLYTTERSPGSAKFNYRNLSETFYRFAPKIFDGVPKKFLPDFKNPCWWAPPLTERGERSASDTHALRCLPYFFLAGMPKSGTTDIHAKLHEHPQVIRTTVKEPHWWTRSYFEGRSLEVYINMQSVKIVPKLLSGSGAELIIGDSSASTFWDNSKWRQFFPDVGVGPPHILAEVIGTVLPDAKIIVAFRNPVDRLYSDFNYFGSFDFDHGPAIFHDLVVKFLRDFQSCRDKTRDYRTCTYDLQNHTQRTKAVRLSIGMYSVYLRDWLKVFPREQIKTVRLEDWHANCTEILPELYHFLQLQKLGRVRVQEICSLQPSNVNKRRPKPMLLETRQLLEDFYLPLNIDLANILQDDKYLWDDP